MSSNLNLTRTCEYCGNTFFAKTTTTRFCSHKCNSRRYKSIARASKIEKSNVEAAKKRHGQLVVAVENKEILNVGEAAKFVGISTKALYRLIQCGRVLASNIGYRMIRVRRDELIKLIDLPDNCAAQPTPTEVIIESNQDLTRENCY